MPIQFLLLFWSQPLAYIWSFRIPGDWGRPNSDTGGEFRSWRSTWVLGSFETVFVLPECHHVGRPERLMVWLGNSPPVSQFVSMGEETGPKRRHSLAQYGR
jgi:hypothetical protein